MTSMSLGERFSILIFLDSLPAFNIADPSLLKLSSLPSLIYHMYTSYFFYNALPASSNLLVHFLLKL